MSYTPIRKQTVRARKNYVCIWCGERIAVGDTYVYEFSKFDGENQVHRWHGECILAADVWFRSEGESEFEPYGNERGAIL